MNKKNKIIIFVMAVAFFVLFLHINNVITSLKSDISQASSDLKDYKDALNEANENINRVNYIIEDAQGEAWSSYQEMGEALENLETAENVSDPLKRKYLFSPKLPLLKLPKIKN